MRQARILAAITVGLAAFTVVAGGIAPLLQNAKSRKAHGGAGAFDLPLAP